MADSKISGLPRADAGTHQEVPVNNIGSTLNLNGAAPRVERSEATLITPPSVGSDGARTRRVTLTSVLDLIGSPGVPKLRIAQGPITDPALNLEGTVTWDDVGDTFTAWKLNVTDKNSHANSKALDLQVGGTTRLDVRKDGYTRVRAVNGTTPAYFEVTDHVGNLFFQVQNDFVGIRNGLRDLVNNGNAFNLGIAGAASFFSVSSSSFFEFRPDESGSAGDICMRRAGTKSLGLFDSTAASPSAGAALRLMEMTAPGTPSTAQVQIYAVDNGGKTELQAKFDDGSTAQICIQP